jgi:hypothetical protein
MMALKKPMGSLYEMGQVKKKSLCEIHHLKFSVEKGEISLKTNSWFKLNFKLFKGCIISKIMDTRHYTTTTVRML